MPKLNERKTDAFRGRLTVTLTEEMLERLRQKAEQSGRNQTRLARELIEKGLEING